MAGDFEEFCVSALPRLLRFGHLLTGDAASAEDLVQTALVRTALRWSRVEDPAKAMAYVKTTMVRQQANRWSRLLSRETVVASPPEVHDPNTAYDDVVERDAMWAALATLGPRQRAVLVLRYYEGLSEAEIAEQLGCAPGTVKSQAAKGLARLRQVLGPEAGKTSVVSR